jgi:Uma2 family endonuclease
MIDPAMPKDARDTDLLTADQLFEIAAHRHCELARGRIVDLAPPGAEHGSVTARIVYLLQSFVLPRGLGDVSTGDTGHRIARAPDTVRGPDVGFIARERIPASGLPRGYWDMAPDLAVEVVAPSDSRSQVEAKTRDWLAAGTREVWLVDPALREVRIARREAPTLVLRPGQMLRSEVLAGFEVAVERVLGS